MGFLALGLHKDHVILGISDDRGDVASIGRRFRNYFNSSNMDGDADTDDEAWQG